MCVSSEILEYSYIFQQLPPTDMGLASIPILPQDHPVLFIRLYTVLGAWFDGEPRILAGGIV